MLHPPKPYPYQPRCGHYSPAVPGVPTRDLRCPHPATHHIVSPDGLCCGLGCEEHAQSCVTEYRENLGEPWTTVEIVVIT